MTKSVHGLLFFLESITFRFIALSSLQCFYLFFCLFLNFILHTKPQSLALNAGSPLNHMQHAGTRIAKTDTTH